MAPRPRQPRSRGLRRTAPAQDTSVAIVEAVVTAAGELLAQRGLAGLTTNHIARRAGVSVGSLYRYFPSKEAIVAELDLRFRSLSVDRFARALERDELALPARLTLAITEFLMPPAEELAMRREFIRQVPLAWIERNASTIWGRAARLGVEHLRRELPAIDVIEAERRVLVALHAVQGVVLGSVLWSPNEIPPAVAATELTAMILPYLLLGGAAAARSPTT